MFHESNTHSLRRDEFNIKSTGPGVWRPHFSPTSVSSLKCEFEHGTFSSIRKRVFIWSQWPWSPTLTAHKCRKPKLWDPVGRNEHRQWVSGPGPTPTSSVNFCIKGACLPVQLLVNLLYEYSYIATRTEKVHVL